MFHASHAGTVVPECFKDDNASQWKSVKFNPRSLRNLWNDRHQNDYVRVPYHYAKFHHDTITPPLCLPNMRKCASSDSGSFFVWLFRQPTAKTLHRFSRSIRQMARFRARVCLLVVPKTNVYILSPFLPQNGKFFAHFRRDWKFRVKKAVTMGMFPCKLPLIVIVAQRKLYSE